MWNSTGKHTADTLQPLASRDLVKNETLQEKIELERLSVWSYVFVNEETCGCWGFHSHAYTCNKGYSVKILFGFQLYMQAALVKLETST